MRTIDCEFSHFAVHPGHGRRYVPFAFLSTKPVLTFSRPKCFVMYMRKKNPRFIPWTRTYRRIHRKTTTDRVTRRRAARTVKAERGINGADLSYIQEVRAKTKKVDRSAKGKAIRAEMAERKAAKK
ncbi:Ribosomal protein L24e-related [Trypanosoma melophagium]|uniref:Ribosomal protein L24e-related n=1 Tax=Trypanosoma melophagium TaxID=715481 RepID=UPI00351A574B|nr:Ribosomal protein L24e-related [Trypanosoma melophagium]KAH9582307.1 Ribosomal protein L24e-related [Trypanosoma melophagium]